MRNQKRLSALAAAVLTGCTHNPYAQDAPPMPAYIAGLDRHDQQVATTGYRLGQADAANALYQQVRDSGRVLPDSGQASAAATPDVKTEIVNIPVPDFRDADGTIKRAHLERIQVVK